MLILWIYVLYRITNKKRIVIIGVFLGILSAAFALLPIVQETVNFFIPLSYIELASPFLEELIKFSFISIYSLVISKNINDVTLLGASAGIGYAFLETFYLYYTIPSIVIMRGYIVYTMNLLTTFISSYGIDMCYRKNEKKWLLLFIVSFIIHYIYNVFLVPLIDLIYI